MIIVSQDREDIINFDNVKMINREENRISVDANFGRGDFYCIAEYDTEERTKEVLSEIYKKYSDWQTMRMVRNEEMQAKIITGDKSDYFDVYIMPEE